MTTASALSKFDILLDKYGSPYFEESEKLEFLNMAQLETLNRLVPDSLGGVVNFESDYNVYQVVLPLIWDIDVPYASQTASGDSSLILRDTIRTSLRTVTTDNTCEVLRILNIGVLESTSPLVFSPVKYVKRNNINSYTANFFKKPTSSNYSYTDGSGVFRIYPNPNTQVRFAVMKTPKILTAGNTPDWDDYAMNQVILQAVKLAGVPLRDSELILDTRNTGIQSAN